MSKPGRPDPPDCLGDAGRALWRQIIGGLEDGWEFDARELAILAEAARCADEMEPLRAAVESEPVTRGSKGQIVANPCQQEVRQLRAVQARLLGALELRDPAKADAGSITSRRARKAARARWGNEKLRAVNG